MTRPIPGSADPAPPSRTEVLLWTDRAALVCNFEKTPELHRHHALQLSIALDTAIWVRVADEPLRRLHNVLIGPGEWHSILGRTAQLYFEPESYGGRVLRAVLGGKPWSCLSEGLAQRCARAFDPRAFEEPSTAWAASATLLEELERGAGLAPLPEDRIWRVMTRLREQPGSRVSLEDLATNVGLSPSRLRHLFREQIGCPIREYVVWLRARAAMGALATESSISATAHDVGFADHPALTRAHRTTWGLSPSQMLRELHFRQPVDVRRANVEKWRQPESLPIEPS